MCHLLYICVSVHKVVPGSPGLSGGLLPVVQGSCEIFHVSQFVHLGEPEILTGGFPISNKGDTCPGRIQQLDCKRSVIFPDRSVREMKKAGRRVPFQVDIGQVLDCADHFVPEWGKFGTIPEDMQHRPFSTSAELTDTGDLREETLQSGRHIVPSGQDFVTCLLDPWLWRTSGRIEGCSLSQSP